MHIADRYFNIDKSVVVNFILEILVRSVWQALLCVLLQR